EGEVALLPVVPLVVVDLVAAAFEDVEGGLVLVAVPVVRALRRQLDEVDLDGLGEERLVARADPPPRPRLRGVSRVRGVVAGVDDNRVVADAGSGELGAPELVEAVRLGREPAYEGAVLLSHGVSLSSSVALHSSIGLNV